MGLFDFTAEQGRVLHFPQISLLTQTLHFPRNMDSNLLSDHKIINGFTPVLTYAACEWFLIFLMFIDALLSYLLVWFARYCRLQMPCFLCSKLLHPLHWRFLLCGNHRSEVSSYMSCHNHGNNLSDCRRMCDDCLLSFTKMTGPNPDMNRLLLGKLGYDLLSKSHLTHPRFCSCCNKPWKTRHHTQRLIRLGSRGRNSVEKPNIPAPRPLSRRGSLKKLRDYKTASSKASSKASSGSEYVEVGSHSKGMAYVGYTELKINSDSDSDFVFSDDAFLQVTDSNVEPSEKRHKKSKSRKPFKEKKVSLPKQPPRLQDKKDKKIHKTVESSVLEDKSTQQSELVRAIEHYDAFSELITMSEAVPFLLGSPRKYVPEAAVQNALVRANSRRFGEEFFSSGENGEPQEIEDQEDDDSTELVRANSSPIGGEFLSPSGENGDSQETEDKENDDSTDFARDIPASAVKRDEAFEVALEQQEVSDNMDESGFVANEPSSDEENDVEGDSKPLTPKNMSDSQEQEQWSGEENEVNENNVAEEYFSNEEEEDDVNGHTEPSTSKDVSSTLAKEESSEEEDRSDVYSVAKDHSSNEEDVEIQESEPSTSKDASSTLAKEESIEEEDRSEGYSVAKDHSINEGDVEIQESEPMTSNNVTGSAKEEHTAKEEHGDHEETAPETEPLESPTVQGHKDSSKVTENDNTSNGPPGLKHIASVESFASISSDIEGENLVEVLKQQLEDGRESLRNLNKELEEERNASAVAINQAMAMITRLQEEKAALHMEALQYLRMMDEQAEHDVDALEKANDVLADKEKEIQDLEMELEYYRTKYPDEPREEILASMGIPSNVEETSGEISNEVSTDTKLTGSPSE